MPTPENADTTQADRELNVEALNVTGDDVGDVGDVVDVASTTNTDPDFTPEPVQKPFNRNSIRDEIAKNFRSGRAREAEEHQEDMDEIRALTSNGLPREFQDQVGDDDVAAINDAVNDDRQARTESTAQQQLETAPSKIKVKINGAERELSQEELIAAAQKALAGDDYLSKAKETAKALIEDVRTELNGLRTATPTVQNQDQGETAQPGADGTEETADENHVDPITAVVEKLQFGTPDEAASELRKLIADEGRKASKDEIAKQRRNMEFTRSMSQLHAFQEANPDLGQDEDAQAVMRVQIFKLQREDLIKAGFDATKLPTDPERMAAIHLDVRSMGGNVRTVPQFLEEAKSNFEKKWRTPSQQQSREAPGQQQQQQHSKPTQPVKAAVEVNVDRTNRRKEITQQPTRTMSPRPDARPQERRDGSSVVQRMQQVRQAPRQGRAATL